MLSCAPWLQFSPAFSVKEKPGAGRENAPGTSGDEAQQRHVGSLLPSLNGRCFEDKLLSTSWIWKVNLLTSHQICSNHHLSLTRFCACSQVFWMHLGMPVSTHWYYNTLHPLDKSTFQLRQAPRLLRLRRGPATPCPCELPWWRHRLERSLLDANPLRFFLLGWWFCMVLLTLYCPSENWDDYTFGFVNIL